MPQELTAQLDLGLLTVLNESYIDNELEEYFSDLVFEVPTQETPDQKVDVVLLFEHKSSPDKHVLIQIGYYMFAHYIKTIRKKEPLKLIIPIIYYQGNRKWNSPQIWKIFKDYPQAIREYLPVINHVFVALNSLSDETLLSIKNTLMGSAMMAQKWRHNPATLVEEIIKVLSLFDREIDDRNFLEMTFIYILNATELEFDSVKKIIESVPPKAKSNIMTTYDKIAQKMKLEGELRNQKETVLRSKEQGLSIPLIANITNLTEEEVKKILVEQGKI